MNDPPPQPAPDASETERPVGPEPQRFGTNWLLRAASVLGLCIWLLITAWIVVAAGFRVADIPGQTFISLAFFNFLFTVAVFYYHRRAIIVDEEGVVVLGALTFRSFPWRDILRVEPDPGFIPGHLVITRSGVFGFSSLEIASHDRLYELLSETHRRRRHRAPTEDPPPEGITETSQIRRHTHGRRRLRRPGRRHPWSAE